MFAKYKTFSTRFSILTLFIFIIFISINFAQAGNTSNNEQCSEKNCSISINHEANTSSFCQTSNFTIFWKKHNDIYLVQCNLNASTQLNPIWVVDTNQKTVSNAPDGRAVKKSFILKSDNNTRVPDRFSSYPLCSLPQKHKTKKSLFTILKKQPNNGDDPYCYDILYIEKNNNNYIFSGNDNKTVKNNEKTSQQVKNIIFDIVKTLKF